MNYRSKIVEVVGEWFLVTRVVEGCSEVGGGVSGMPRTITNRLAPENRYRYLSVFLVVSPEDGSG